MPSYTEQIKQLLQSKNVKFIPKDDKTIVAMFEMPKNEGAYVVAMLCREEQTSVILYGIADFTIPEHKRPIVTEYLVRANFDMLCGNLEMDLKDGEVRFKICTDFGKAANIKPVVWNMLQVLNSSFSGHVVALRKLMNGEVLNAEAALQIAEAFN